VRVYLIVFEDSYKQQRPTREASAWRIIFSIMVPYTFYNTRHFRQYKFEDFISFVLSL